MLCVLRCWRDAALRANSCRGLARAKEPRDTRVMHLVWKTSSGAECRGGHSPRMQCFGHGVEAGDKSTDGGCHARARSSDSSAIASEIYNVDSSHGSPRLWLHAAAHRLQVPTAEAICRCSPARGMGEFMEQLAS